MTPFYGLGKFAYYRNQGACVAVWTGQRLYLAFFLVIFLILVGIIVVTSIWTCCFTRKFLEQHQAGSNIYVIYVNKNRKLIGIFGSLLLVCALCFGPGVLAAVIRFATNEINVFMTFISIFCFYSITVANPLVQSFFRPDVRDTVKYMFSKCSSHTPSDTVENGPITNISSTAV